MAEDAAVDLSPPHKTLPPQAIPAALRPARDADPAPSSALPALPAAAAGTLLADPRAGGRGNGPVRAATALHLQRTAGNGAVRRILQRVGDAADAATPLQHMATAFGADFSDVTVHEGPEAAAIGARAYTHGSTIHFAPGEYAPQSPGGQELLGHELAHVVQQRAGQVPTPHAGGLVANIDPGLEAEAAQMGGQAARGEPVATGGRGARPTGAAAGAVIQPELTPKMREVLVEVNQQHAEIPLELLEVFFKKLTKKEQEDLTHQRNWFVKQFDKVTKNDDVNAAKDKELQAQRIKAVWEYFNKNGPQSDLDDVAIGPAPTRVAYRGLQGTDKQQALNQLNELGSREFNRINDDYNFDKDFRMKNENLVDYELISGADSAFNCIGLTLGHTGYGDELEPKSVNPRMGSEENPLAEMDLLYARQGYKRLEDLDFTFVQGQQKVIVYGMKDKDEKITSIEHAAIQDTQGKWHHKLGEDAHIKVAGATEISVYGPPLAVYARTQAPQN